MASTPVPIVLHDHTKAGIRWRVSIHPELSAEGTVVVRFLKRGRPGRLLDQLCRWSPQGGWAPGHRPSCRVPQALQRRIEAELQRHHRPRREARAIGPQVPGHRRIAGVSEAISCGRMNFRVFLRMELVEAYLPLWNPRHTPSQAH